MLIDAHAHVFAFPKNKLPDSTTFMSAEEQVTVMNAKGVDKAVSHAACEKIMWRKINKAIKLGLQEKEGKI